MLLQECLIRRKIAKKNLKFFEKLQVKTKGIFFKINKWVSNDSELSNSARKEKKKFGGSRR